MSGPVICAECQNVIEDADHAGFAPVHIGRCADAWLTSTQDERKVKLSLRAEKMKSLRSWVLCYADSLLALQALRDELRNLQESTAGLILPHLCKSCGDLKVSAEEGGLLEGALAGKIKVKTCSC